MQQIIPEALCNTKKTSKEADRGLFAGAPVPLNQEARLEVAMASGKLKMLKGRFPNVFQRKSKASLFWGLVSDKDKTTLGWTSQLQLYGFHEERTFCCWSGKCFYSCVRVASSTPSGPSWEELKAAPRVVWKDGFWDNLIKRFGIQLKVCIYVAFPLSLLWFI